MRLEHVLGSRLREARLRAGMTQTQLARTIKTSERNIQRWEAEANAPRLKYLAAIADATGQSVAHFLESDGDDDDEEDAVEVLVSAVRSFARSLQGATA